MPQGSGRTDAGVHALGQIATVQSECVIPAANFVIALNDILPASIRVLAAEELYGIPNYAFPKARPNLSGGTAVSSLNVDEHYSTYTYDGGTGTYNKTEEGHKYVDASLKQPVRIEMVMVISGHAQAPPLDEDRKLAGAALA